MSVDRRLLNWGVFLILVGSIPLAVNQGWIPRDLVSRAWELWPLILVGAGIGLILRATPLRPIGGLIVAGVAGLIVGAAVAVGVGGLTLGGFGCGAAAADAPHLVGQQGTFDASGNVILDARCASVVVTTAAGRGWSLDVSGDDGARPTVDSNAGSVTVRSPNGPTSFPFASRRATWRATLGTDPSLDLDIHVDAGDATVDLKGANLSRLAFEGNAIGATWLDLSNARVAELAVKVNAASASILLPSTGSLNGTVEANAASIGICAPSGLGVRLVVDQNITASNNFGDRGLAKTGSTWESPGYATATARAELHVSGSAVSYKLNPEGGCR